MAKNNSLIGVATYYNTTDKEISIVLGYSFTCGISMGAIKKYIKKINKVFPLTKKEKNTLSIFECASSSRTHARMFYTTFKHKLKLKNIPSGITIYDNASDVIAAIDY